MPIKLKANNGNIDLKAPIKQVGGKVDSVNGMTGDVVLDIPSKTSDLVNDSGFLTHIPDEYITETELDAKGYLTEHQSLAEYAKKSEIPDVSGFLTSIPDEYVTEAELDAKGYLTEHQSLAEYAKKSDIPDVSNYVTDTELNTAISSAEERVDFKLGSYALKTEVPSVEGLASTQYVDNKVSEIVVPSLEGYATEQWVENKNYLTQHQSLDEYAKKSELFSKDYNDLTNKPTIPSVEGLASTNYVDEKVAAIVVPSLDGYATEQWVEGKGYLTQHQSLADYATKSELATKQDTLTAGNNITIENGVISATGGSGGDSYTLPVANKNTLGGVKVIHNSILSSGDGNKVLMDDNNRLFVPYASTTGGVGLAGFNPDYFDIDLLKSVSPKKATIAKLGVVKPDGDTITIDDNGIISAAGSSGSSDTRFIVINKNVSDTLTDEEGALLYKVATNLGKYSLTFINNGNEYNNCIRIYKDNNSSRYYFVFYNTMYNDTSNNRIVRYYGSPINNKIKKLTYDWQYDTTLLDTNNWSSYISVPSDWNYTADISDSNLYNAKEIAIYWEYNNIYHCNYYNFSSNNCLGYFNGYTFCAMNNYNNGNSTWDYNGSTINTNNMNIQNICYKT